MRVYLFLVCAFVGGFVWAVEGSKEAAQGYIPDESQKQSQMEFLKVQMELYKDNITANEKEGGYHGVWYDCPDPVITTEYAIKYAGGNGTYCAFHRPLAIYSPQADKTFFCYGGSQKGNNKALMHIVSYYDHKTGMVPRPTIVLDKETDDAHDNPVISIDDKGYIWVFSTAHGTGGPSYIHKSRQPYSIDEFEQINAVRGSDIGEIPFVNFSYFQPWNVAGKGFGCFMSLYFQPVMRTSYFISSADGINWTKPVCISVMGVGSYNVSLGNSSKIASAFNYHPVEGRSDARTNLYYIETLDFGKTWQNAAGEELELPLADTDNKALVYKTENIPSIAYTNMRDMAFDKDNNPVILLVNSAGWEPGPKNSPRTWSIVKWNGGEWEIIRAFDSDNNYDTGSIFINDDKWSIVAPTVVGPQAYNPGGEMMMWESINQGQTWNRVKQLTVNSPRNHNYARGVINADPDFWALWADGDGRKPSISNLYFCDSEGNVFMLPREMKEDFEKPIKVQLGTIK